MPTARNTVHSPFFALLAWLSCAGVLSGEVKVEEAVYKGLPHYKISTPSATYWLEKTGAGLSRMIDPEGNDWLSFDPEPGSGAGGEYRGFPNAVHQQSGNYFHARNKGTDPARTKLEDSSREHATISVTSEDGRWEARYDFSGTHCLFTMVKMPADRKYWVLYEGTPGGIFEESDWWMTSAVPSPQSMNKRHDGDIPGPEWIVFGDPKQERVLFVYHVEDDEHPDRFYQMENKMTVFGFGRAGLTKFLDKVPQNFAIGFLNTTNHTEISDLLEEMSSIPGKP